MDEISELLIAVWDRIEYSAEDNFRYQIEVAMMAAGFITRVKDAQVSGRINEDQGQRITRSVAKAIETLFRAGAFTEDMDQVREVRASQFLVPKTQLLEYRREEARVEFKSIEMRDGLDGTEKAELLTRLQEKELVAAEKLESAVVATATPVAVSAARLVLTPLKSGLRQAGLRWLFDMSPA